MAALTVRTINFGTRTPGATPSYAGVSLAAAMTTPTATTGDTFANDGRTLLRVKNASGAGITVTVTARKASDQGILEDLVFPVALTSGDIIIGPFNPAEFNDANGAVTVICSAVTSVTLDAFRMAERGRG